MRFIHLRVSVHDLKRVDCCVLRVAGLITVKLSNHENHKTFYNFNVADFVGSHLYVSDG